MTCADDDSLEQKRPPPSMGQPIERISLSPLVVPRQESMSIRGLLNPQELPRDDARPPPSTRRAENVFKQEDGLPRMLSKRPLDLLDDAVCPKRGLSCNVPACPNKAVSKGRCITHGGGCRCKIPGCKNGAKMYGLCHLHGGRKQCKATGCNKFAKSMGLCWAHGGSKTCGIPLCGKGALKGGYCWAHGGGKRCLVDACQKPVKHGTCCAQHTTPGRLSP